MTNNNNKEDAKVFTEFHDIIRYYAKDKEIQGILKDGNRDRRPKDTDRGEGWSLSNLMGFGGT